MTFTVRKMALTVRIMALTVRIMVVTVRIMVVTVRIVALTVRIMTQIFQDMRVRVAWRGNLLISTPIFFTVRAIILSVEMSFSTVKAVPQPSNGGIL